MSYYLQALILIAQGARYGRTNLVGTLAMVALRRCRLHWLRDDLRGAWIREEESN